MVAKKKFKEKNTSKRYPLYSSEFDPLNEVVLKLSEDETSLVASIILPTYSEIRVTEFYLAYDGPWFVEKDSIEKLDENFASIRMDLGTLIGTYEMALEFIEDKYDRMRTRTEARLAEDQARAWKRGNKDEA